MATPFYFIFDFCIFSSSFLSIGFAEDDDEMMSFPASCIRFGPVKVESTQNVELSRSQLRIVFRKKGSSTENVTFHANPLQFGKTIYNWHEKSVSFIFCITDKQFEHIQSEIEFFLETSKTTKTGKIDFLCQNNEQIVILFVDLLLLFCFVAL